MNAIALLGGVLLILALLGFLGAIPVLKGAASALVIVAVMMLVWCIIVGRRPV